MSNESSSTASGGERMNISMLMIAFVVLVGLLSLRIRKNTLKVPAANTFAVRKRLFVSRTLSQAVGSKEYKYQGSTRM